MRYGAKSITMDDVSRELGISKKTLYKYVEDKADLIKKVIEQHIINEEGACNSLSTKATDAIDEMIKISMHVSQHIRQINPAMLMDVQRYYRESWDLIEKHRTHFVNKAIVNNIARGRWEGLYRTDFDETIVTRFYLAKAKVMFDSEIFPYPEFDLPKVFKTFIDCHIRAIVSAKGLELYHRYQSLEMESWEWWVEGRQFISKKP